MIAITKIPNTNAPIPTKTKVTVGNDSFGVGDLALIASAAIKVPAEMRKASNCACVNCGLLEELRQEYGCVGADGLVRWLTDCEVKC